MGFTALWLAVLAASLVSSTGASSKDDKEDNFDLFERINGMGYYHFVSALYNWTEAYEHCQSLGSHLAVANSVSEAEALATLVQVYATDHEYAFIGVSDINVRGEFLTVQGDLMARSGYDQWTGSEPSFAERCAGISRSGEGYIHVDCSVHSPSICEIPVWRKEYTLVEGVGYYKTYRGGLAWPQALMICSRDDAHLAIINSEEEHRAILDIFNEEQPDIPGVSFDDFIWLGGHSQFNLFNYVTIFGVPISETGFNIWEAGQPGDSPGYLGLNRNGYLGTKYAWIAYPEAWPAVCEHELV